MKLKKEIKIRILKICCLVLISGIGIGSGTQAQEEPFDPALSPSIPIYTDPFAPVPSTASLLEDPLRPHHQTQSFVIVVEKPIPLLSRGSERQLAALNIKNLLKEDAEPRVLRRWRAALNLTRKEGGSFRQVHVLRSMYKER